MKCSCFMKLVCDLSALVTYSNCFWHSIPINFWQNTCLVQSNYLRTVQKRTKYASQVLMFDILKKYPCTLLIPILLCYLSLTLASKLLGITESIGVANAAWYITTLLFEPLQLLQVNKKTVDLLNPYIIICWHLCMFLYLIIKKKLCWLQQNKFNKDTSTLL